MKKITEELLKDAFIDLVDNGWIPSIGSEYYTIHSGGGEDLESGKTIFNTLKKFLNSKPLWSNINTTVECNKKIVIYISNPNNNVLKFKEYREFQQEFLGCLGNFCDEIGIDEDKVNVENESNSDLIYLFKISIIQDMFNIENINKFINFEKSFNTKFRTFNISIGLYDDGIKLNIPDDVSGSNKDGWYNEKRKAMEMIKKDFDIEKKDFSIYLHPKFEFIQNENI